MDELDKSLVALLQMDARKTNRDLAAQLHVTEGTVGARLKRLQATQTIRFAAVLDFFDGGTQLLVMLMVRVHGRPAEEVAQDLARIPGSLTVTVITGSWDIFASYIREDLGGVRELLSDDLARIDGVQDVESSLAVDVIVSKPTWEFTGFESSARRNRLADP